MKKSMLIICGVLAVATPATAASFKAINRLLVNSVSDTDLEVVETRSLGASGSWCAAADFADRVWGSPGKTDLIIKTPRGPSVTKPGKRGVMFTIDPNQVSAPLQKSVSVTTKTAGLTMTVGHGLALCSQSLIDIGP